MATTRLSGWKRCADFEEDAHRDSPYSSIRQGPPHPSTQRPPALSHRDYEIGWICAIHVEFVAAQAMLDETHDDLPPHPNDSNYYVLGRIGRFNVVITCLPAGGMGMNNAAIVSNNMQRSYTSIQVQLMVGVAGGVPTTTNDVRLGDVVVGLRVVQHDFGKTMEDGTLQHTDPVYTPSTRISKCLTAMRAEHELRACGITNILEQMLLRNPEMDCYASCGQLRDILFESASTHQRNEITCDSCDLSSQIVRPARAFRGPQVHYGVIASGNQVVKNAMARDLIGYQHDALCLEMEGAALKGVDVPFLVIRGICDYADSHKNKQWQPYAAGVAAACAREILSLFLSPCAKQVSLESRTPVPHKDPEQADTNCNISALMESLSFDLIDARQANIKTAHSKTCRWLFKKPEYLDWLDHSKYHEHHGLLWIKGKPGAGKSTIMKVALTELSKKKYQHTVISFFFHARGDRMEKSVQGMYQSLLLQLLTRLPQLKSLLDTIRTTTNDTSTHKWTIPTLQGLLQDAVVRAREVRLICLIDAVDECDPDEVRDMVYFFEDIRSTTAESGRNFHVCFASRHYPHITVHKGIDLVLDGQEGHEQDIADYTKSCLHIGQSETARKIQTNIQAKASGIFMWVVLVVKILNERSDSGMSLTTLQRELDKIPQDLHKLFHDILLRDKNMRDEMLLCMQWVLFARRPLAPRKLYLAVQAGIGGIEEISTAWDDADISSVTLSKFILSVSKGLVEITKSKTPVAQFIHESVKDFLLEENSLFEVWPSLGTELKSLSHETLKACCMRYIGIQSELLRLPADNIGKDEAESLRSRISSAFPFMAYAVDGLLYHANQSPAVGIAQFVSDFSSLAVRWVALHNILERFASRRYATPVSLLYLFAERDCARLIGAMPADLSCLKVEPGERLRYGPPLLAALALENYAAAEAFLMGLHHYAASQGINAVQITPEMLRCKSERSRVKRDLTFSERLGLHWYLAEHGNEYLFRAISVCLPPDLSIRDHKGQTILGASGCEPILTWLLEHGATADTRCREGKTPLMWLAAAGKEWAVAPLLRHGAAIDAVNNEGQTALICAARSGHDSVVQALLQHGATIDVVDHNGRTALICAALSGHDSVAQALLQHGAAIDATGVNAHGGLYGTALQAASSKGYVEIVTLLLEKGTNTNAQGGDYGSALYTASSRGHAEVITILLEKGADINAQGGDYGNALQAASSEGYVEIVTLLLEKRADVNAQGGFYGSALQAASSRGHVEVITLLLEKGANINAQGGYFGNALQAASFKGHVEIVTLLLEKGADIYSQDGHYGSALQAASSEGHVKIVTLLIEKGADINAQGGYFGNALQAASFKGYVEIVTLLLKKGADIYSQDSYYGSALQAASSEGHVEIITLLIEKGADVNAQGGFYGSALQAASSRGHVEVITLLLEKGADINAQGGYFGNALQAASFKGHVEIVKLLVQRS